MIATSLKKVIPQSSVWFTFLPITEILLTPCVSLSIDSQLRQYVPEMWKLLKYYSFFFSFPI